MKIYNNHIKDNQAPVIVFQQEVHHHYHIDTTKKKRIGLRKATQWLKGLFVAMAKLIAWKNGG